MTDDKNPSANAPDDPETLGRSPGDRASSDAGARASDVATTSNQQTDVAPQGKSPAEPLRTRRRIKSLDLSNLGKTSPGRADIAKQREDVREYIAKRFLILLGGTVFLGFLLMVTSRWTHVTEDMIRTYFQTVFPAVVTLVSGAAAFYFATSNTPDRSDDD